MTDEVRELKISFVLQDRRNRKSRTASMDIELMKESSGPAEADSKVGPSESNTSEANNKSD